MRISYDYEELLEEVREELEDGVVKLTDQVQVLRSSDPIDGSAAGYRPIVDWYYSHDQIMEDLQTDAFDDHAERAEIQDMKHQYEQDRFRLEPMSVALFIHEMEIMGENSEIDVKSIVGRNLRAQRITQGLTQAELGRRLGLKQQQIARYENGEYDLTLTKLREIELALGLPACTLLKFT